MSNKPENAVKVRFPAEIKDWLRIKAAQNRRSMTSEVVDAVARAMERAGAHDASRPERKTRK